MKIYTKESLIEEFRKIQDMGWILGARHGNVGSVGNTLEDLLGIQENNLPIPNAAEWELKCQRANTRSLVTLFHTEPSPRAIKFVPLIFLRKYGWPYQKAGILHGANELSFRQTISGLARNDRGFKKVSWLALSKAMCSWISTLAQAIIMALNFDFAKIRYRCSTAR